MVAILVGHHALVDKVANGELIVVGHVLQLLQRDGQTTQFILFNLVRFIAQHLGYFLLGATGSFTSLPQQDANNTLAQQHGFLGGEVKIRLADNSVGPKVVDRDVKNNGHSF